MGGPRVSPDNWAKTSHNGVGGVAMSALGQKQTLRNILPMSALPPKADIHPRDQDVCFGPKADIQAAFGYYCWWARVLKFVEHHP